MPKQYAFTIWRAGKKSCTYYTICSNEEIAKKWMLTQSKIWEFGELGIDWEIQSITSRPLTEVYDNDGDRVGYLCELAEELFAREVSNNCPNTELRGLNWNDLCDGIIEIAQALKGK